MKDRELKEGERMLENANRVIAKHKALDRFEELQSQFDRIEARLTEPVSLATLGYLPAESQRLQREEVEKITDRLIPLARELTSYMARFLKRFPDEQTDLDPNVDSISSFRAFVRGISVDDLPKHEERFKRRLNENVLKEVGLLHGSLEDERPGNPRQDRASQHGPEATRLEARYLYAIGAQRCARSRDPRFPA